MMMASASNLPAQRRRLNFGNADTDDENDSFEPMKWFPVSPLPTDYHCIKRRKSVSFHDPVVYSVATLEELTDEEHDNVWYSREEYAALQSALRTAVKLFRKSNWMVTSKDQCRRGLEKYQLQYERKRMERQHYDAVLSEQRRQREFRLFDAELLRQASLINSSWAIQNAQRSAQQDALACQQYEQQQQRSVFFFPLQLQDDSRTALETMDSCDDDDYNVSNHRIAADMESFPHLPSLFAATRLPTPPPTQTKKPSARTTVVALA